MPTARRRLKSPRSLSGTSAYHTMVTLVYIVVDEWMTQILFVPCQSATPFLRKNLFQTLTLKLQGQGHGCGQLARSYNRPSIILTHFLFISHQSDQQFLRSIYFEIWPSDIQGQGHEWGQRSRSHIVPSIQPIICQNNSFQRKFS